MADSSSDFADALRHRYALHRQIGHGGMATVFEAEDLKHHRRVAVKVLRTDIAGVLGPERFLHEIEVVARLHHPHILPLYDSGEAAGHLYYVMPFVEGESLRDRLERETQLPLADALSIGAEVADGLAYAHTHGVVHRDIKPENILLESGHAMVGDFGIARAIDAAGGDRMTQTGVTLGSPKYMSPEQAAGDRQVDARSDLYSLGCLLYEMLAGEPPFTGPTVQRVLQQHLTADPRRVSLARPAVPAELADLVAKALSKSPADRWSSADELHRRLRALAQSGDQTARASVQPSTGRRILRWSLVAAAVAVAALTWSRLASRSAPLVTLGQRSQVSFSPGLEVHPALSPRGDLVAYTAGWTSRLFVKQVAGGNPVPLARDLQGAQGWPHWAPDGSQLSFASNRGMEIVPALGGTPRLLVPAPPGGVASSDKLIGGPGMVIGGPWSPDGREVSFIRRDTLYAAPVDGDTIRMITTGPGMHSCAWSNNGDWIACVQGNGEAMMLGPVFGNLAQSRIVMVRAAGGPLVQLTADGFANGSPAWMPDGTLLFVSDREGGRDLYSVRINRAGRMTGTPRRVTTGLNALTVTVAANGSRLAYDAFSETSNIWTSPASPSHTAAIADARQVTSGDQVIEHFDISRDGRWLVFAASRGGLSHLYRAPLDRPDDGEQLTRDSVDEFQPVWSPDGRRIAFHSFTEGRRQVFLIPAEGGPAVRVRSGDDDRDPRWSHDGTFMLTLTNYGRPDAETRVVRLGPDGTWSTPARWRRPPCPPRWSADGRQLACVEHTGRLLLVNETGDSLRLLVERGPLTDIDAYPGWSADGRTIYYLGADSTGIAVFSIPVAGGTPHIALRFDDPTRPWHRYGFEVVRDRFYFTVGDRQSHLWLAEIQR